MNHRSITLLMLLSAALILFAAAPVRADKYAGEFLELGLGARSLGLGSSFTALAEDASGGYWNPAGLPAAPRRQLLLTHTEQFGGLETYDAGAWVQPLGGDEGRRSAWAATVLRLAIPDVPDTRGLPYDDRNGDGRFTPGVDSVMVDPSLIRYRTFSYNTALLSYGREHGEATAFGATAKLIYDAFDTNSAMGIGLDLGARHRVGDWTLAAVLKDATSTLIVWDTDNKETVSPSLRLGCAWRREVPAIAGSITLAGELVSQFEHRGENAATFSAGAWSGELRGGAEYSFRERLALRAGTNDGVWSAGAGLMLGRFGIDYAFLQDDGLASSHRVSASVGF